MIDTELDSMGLRSSYDVGKQLKSISYWNCFNYGFNTSGFKALPAGADSDDGPSFGTGDGTSFWTSSGFNEKTAWIRNLYCKYNGVSRFYTLKNYNRISVRCIKD